MSQNWPPPPQQPNQPYPPPGSFPVRQSNGWAIASLVCGILGCVPVITSLLAAIFGIVGIRKGGKPNGSGKGLAIAGLILGLLGLIGWGLIGGGAVLAFMGSAEPRAVARQFAQDLSAGKIEAAAAVCTADVTREELDAASQALQKLGPVSDVVIPFGFKVNRSAGSQATWQIPGAIKFNNQQLKSYMAEIQQQGTDYKIVHFKIE